MKTFRLAFVRIVLDLWPPCGCVHQIRVTCCMQCNNRCWSYFQLFSFWAIAAGPFVVYHCMYYQTAYFQHDRFRVGAPPVTSDHNIIALHSHPLVHRFLRWIILAGKASITKNINILLCVVVLYMCCKVRINTLRMLLRASSKSLIKFDLAL